jgi:hypothetical protein
VINTQGALLYTLGTGHSFGALAWNGSLLWGAGDYGWSPPTQNLFKVNPTTGASVAGPSSFGFSKALCPNQAPNNADGLAIAGGNIWLSDDQGKIAYKLSATGQVLSNITFTPYCNTGIAYDGASLWFALYLAPCIGCALGDAAFIDGVIERYTTTGVFLSAFGTDGMPYEGIAYDPVSFAPNCALWGISDGEPFGPFSTITAFSVPCTPSSPPAHDLAVLSVTNLPIAYVGYPLAIYSTVINLGSSSDIADVTMLVNGQQLFTQKTTLATGQFLILQQNFTPLAGGSFFARVTVSLVPGEPNPDPNNALTGPVFYVSQAVGSGGSGGGKHSFV